jgi:hypothetical protein
MIIRTSILNQLQGNGNLYPKNIINKIDNTPPSAKSLELAFTVLPSVGAVVGSVGAVVGSVGVAGVGITLIVGVGLGSLLLSPSPN